MKHWTGIALICCLAMAIGCSGGTDLPITPDNSTPRDSSATSTHQLWGLYQCIADPVAETLDIIPLRAVDMHLNALPFLEPPPLVNLTLESLEFNGNILDADIGLRHPFLGLTEFTGFDVCGILISQGSVSGFNDPALQIPGPDDLHLVNPDGYTRWWNPAEFPINTGTMFGYNDGLLGAPDSYADYSATLNGYKYFADDITVPTGDLSAVDPSGRGVFSAGQKNVRRFTIDMGTTGLIFNYAVDANWVFPDGSPPWEAPDDFSEYANRPEAWNIVITETENTLWNDGVDNGGDLSLSIDVYDWFNADLNTVYINSTGNFPAASSAVALTGGVGYSTYEIDIVGATPAETQIDLFITVECEAVDYGGMLTGKTQAAYFTSTADVSGETPQPEDPEEWACFQYNAAGIGRNPNIQNFDHTDYSQTWYAPLSGRYKMGGPAITEDYIYTVTLSSAYSSNTNHFLYCLDLNNSGATVWFNNINPPPDPGHSRGMTSPVWFDDGGDGRVVVGGDRVWCFDALDGTLEWQYGESEGLWVQHGPRFYNDRIYIARAGAMHCLNAYSGAHIWSSAGSLTSFETTPAVADGKVYFANSVNFTCLDADNGDVLWQTPSTDGQSHWDAPLVVNGRVYLATYHQGLRCFDADDGTLYWTLDPSLDAYITGLTYWIDPTDQNVVIYMGSAFSYTGCIAVKDNGSTGSIFWQSAAHYFDGSPVFNEGVVYIGDTSGTLYGYDCETGAVVFTQAISGGIRNAIGFAFGRMIVPASNAVYCFETE